VAVVGINSKLEGEEMKTDHPGFLGGDRTSLDLPAEEQRLLEAVKATGKPLVVVLMSGSALAVNWAQQHADAIVHAWYGGQEAGTAIAEVLSGDVNPAGRLPVTFYTGVDQLPAFDDYAMDRRTYRYFTGKPLYPFGYGLSYTRFAYGPVMLSAARVAAGQPLQAKVVVRNAGTRAGDEVVQAYLRFPRGTPGAPRLALRGFARVHLKPGEAREVTLRFDPRDLSHVQPDGQRVVGAAGATGEYQLAIGGGQPQTGAPGSSRSFRIVGRVPLPR
jgi:beta-glucosidase